MGLQYELIVIITADENLTVTNNIYEHVMILYYDPQVNNQELLYDQINLHRTFSYDQGQTTFYEILVCIAKLICCEFHFNVRQQNLASLLSPNTHLNLPIFYLLNRIYAVFTMTQWFCC